MKKHIIKKIFIFGLSLFFIITATFFLIKILPGDPFTQAENLPKEVKEALYAHYGLDKSLWTQYLQYLKGVFSLDFGPSYVYEKRGVAQIIKDAFLPTFVLGMQSFFLSVFLGISIGSIAGLKKGRKIENLIMIVTSIFISIPNFVIAALLQYIFSIKLQILPVARWDSYAHSILPTLTLTCLPAAFIARLIRNSLKQVYNAEYIQTAIAKGLGPFRIFFKHCLRNSLLPVIAYLGPLMTYLLTGSFVTEKIFAIPGLGMWMIQSILSRDYTVIMGLTIFYSFLLLLMNLSVDMLNAFLDPRIQVFTKNQVLYESRQD